MTQHEDRQKLISDYWPEPSTSTPKREAYSPRFSRIFVGAIEWVGLLPISVVGFVLVGCFVSFVLQTVSG
jgi:hypothetical protein